MAFEIFGNNKTFIPATAGTVLTFNFKESGDDTATVHYGNLGHSFAVTKVRIDTSHDLVITHINGKELKDAREIGNTGGLINITGTQVPEIRSLKVRTTNSTQKVTVLYM